MECGVRGRGKGGRQPRPAAALVTAGAATIWCCKLTVHAPPIHAHTAPRRSGGRQARQRGLRGALLQGMLWRLQPLLPCGLLLPAGRPQGEAPALGHVRPAHGTAGGLQLAQGEGRGEGAPGGGVMGEGRQPGLGGKAWKHPGRLCVCVLCARARVCVQGRCRAPDTHTCAHPHPLHSQSFPLTHLLLPRRPQHTQYRCGRLRATLPSCAPSLRPCCWAWPWWAARWPLASGWQSCRGASAPLARTPATTATCSSRSMCSTTG